MSGFSPGTHDIFIVAARTPTTCFQIQHGMVARVGAGASHWLIEKSFAPVLEHLKQALRSSTKLTPNSRANQSMALTL